MGLREEKKRQQRLAILDVASDLFRRRGYDQTRVRDIAQHASISEGTFFNYFPTKDAVLHGLADVAVDLYAAMIEQELRRVDQPAPQRLRDLMRTLAVAAVNDPELHVLVYTRSGLFHAAGELKQKELRLYDRLAELLRQGQAHGEIRADADPLQLAEALTAIQHLLISNWLTRWWGLRDDLPARVDGATAIFLEGCRPVGSANAHRRRQGPGRQATKPPARG